MVVDEPVAIGLVADDFDSTVLGVSAQYRGDAVGAVKLLTVLVEEFQNLARRHRLVSVGLFEDRPDSLELAPA